jgi:hypothetical protein
LKEGKQRKTVVAPQQPAIQSIQLVSHQMMQCHAGMLRRALNQPIQRVPLLNLKPLSRGWGNG